MSRSDMIYDDIDILYRNFPFLVEKIPPIPGKGTSFVHRVWVHLLSGYMYIRIHVDGLRIGTGAEIETALCILESAALYPTCKVSPRGRPETRNLGIWHLGSLRVGPERAPGNSETRNLEFGGPLGLDPARGGLGNSETRNLEYGCPSD